MKYVQLFVLITFIIIQSKLFRLYWELQVTIYFMSLSCVVSLILFTIRTLSAFSLKIMTITQMKIRERKRKRGGKRGRKRANISFSPDIRI